MRGLLAAGAVVALVGAAAVVPTAAAARPLPTAPDCPMMPADTVWHLDVSAMPLHPMSDTWVDAIGRGATVHPDFGSGEWDGGPIGIPWTTVPGSQERVDVSFDYASESDPGPYPIPPDVPIEGGPDADGDRHALVVDRDTCVLYELFDAAPRGDGGWHAGSGAVFDLTGSDLRPAEWTSADAAGLPILPLLVRADEVAAGAIDHPLRFTAPRTRDQWIWPARHQAGSDDASLPPMGAWLRLKADVDLSGFSEQARVVATAMQQHGMILSDNGSPWFVSGAPDEWWDNDALRDLKGLSGGDFEAVDVSGAMVDPDSALVAASAEVYAARIAGADRFETAVALSQTAFPDGAEAAVVVRADDFADALAATPLAAAVGGPTLLSHSDRLTDVTRDELERLGVDTVHLVGGEAALSPAVASGVPSGVAVERHAGADRFATAVAVADEAVGVWRGAGDADAGEAAVIALGVHPDPSRAWVDALGAGVLAARTHARLLFVTPDRIPRATAAGLDGVAAATIAGGPAAVGAAVEDDLRAEGIAVERVSGNDRWETAVALALASVGAVVPTTSIVASGQAFPDALAAGSAVAATTDAVLLLTGREFAPTATVDALSEWRPEVRVAGGRGAITDATVGALLTAAR